MKRNIKIIAIISLMAFIYTLSGCDDATSNTQNTNTDIKQEQQNNNITNVDNTNPTINSNNENIKNTNTGMNENLNANNKNEKENQNDENNKEQIDIIQESQPLKDYYSTNEDIKNFIFNKINERRKNEGLEALNYSQDLEKYSLYKAENEAIDMNLVDECKYKQYNEKPFTYARLFHMYKWQNKKNICIFSNENIYDNIDSDLDLYKIVFMDSEDTYCKDIGIGSLEVYKNGKYCNIVTVYVSQANKKTPKNDLLEKLNNNNIIIKSTTDMAQPEDYKLPTNYESYIETEIEDEVIDLVNKFRIENGLNKLQKSDYLTNTAEYKSNAMIQYDYFLHKNPWMDDSENCTSLIFAFGKDEYNLRGIGENILEYKGVYIDDIINTTAQEIFNLWESSPGHRANMLNEDWNYIGVGVVIGYLSSSDYPFQIKATQHFSILDE